METNIYISAIPLDWNDASLHTCFSQFGTIDSIKILRDKAGNSKGAGFVQYTTPACAIAAVQSLHGQTPSFPPSSLPLRPLSVKFAQRYEHHGGAAGGANGANGTHQPGSVDNTANQFMKKNNVDENTVYVAGLSPSLSKPQIFSFFSLFGPILSLKLLVNPSRVSRGIVFIRYENSDSAQITIERMDGQVMDEGGMPLQVRYAKEQKNTNDKKQQHLQRQLQIQQLQQLQQLQRNNHVAAAAAAITNTALPFNNTNAAAYMFSPSFLPYPLVAPYTYTPLSPLNNVNYAVPSVPFTQNMQTGVQNINNIQHNNHNINNNLSQNINNINPNNYDTTQQPNPISSFPNASNDSNAQVSSASDHEQ